MHQVPRRSPSTASPASSEQTNPTRTNNQRDRDLQGRRTASPLTQGSGSSEDFTNARQDQPAQDPAASMQRLNQVIQNFHTKAALIILHSRTELSPAYSSKTNEKRVNKWFNIELDETDDYLEEIKRWKRCDVKDDRPPPLVIEIFLTTDSLSQQGQRLVILDDDQKRWDVSNALQSSQTRRSSKRRAAETNEIILERWTIELGDATSPIPTDLAAVLPLVYKKSIILFRSLYAYCHFLPTWKLLHKIGKSRSTMAMKLGYRIVDGSRLGEISRPDTLNLPLYGSATNVLLDYSLDSTESPAGPFSVSVQYRENVEFRIDDTEELLSSRFIGADDDLFRPSLPRDHHNQSQQQGQPIGSLPTDQRKSLLERPELGHAYGSLSTFHQAGISPGTSPISALRAAKDLGSDSPSPEQTRTVQPLAPQVSQRQTTAPRPSSTTTGRRSSFTFQPFKSPALGASPMSSSPLASSPRPGKLAPTLGSLTEEGTLPLPNAQTVAARKITPLASETVVASSTSSSPKPAPVARFSSSFSHRRSRSSTDRVLSRTDEDQTSSGKASAASSTQPGSGLIAEPTTTGGGSSGSVHEDDENISDFLKMLDTKKDLLNPSSSAAADASARRTAAALNRFHRMRDSNAALSESMSSSLMLPRSSASSSRQLTSTGPPPGPVGASISTSSSPGKPVSPHTPHMPFTPSRLSAALSHDDFRDQQGVEDGRRAPATDSATDGAANDPALAAQISAIPIPNSPRFGPGFRRSTSAQRRPLSSEDDIGDLYGMKSASMGAQDQRSSKRDLSKVSSATDATVSTSSGVSTEQRRRQSSLSQVQDQGLPSVGGGTSTTSTKFTTRTRRGHQPPLEGTDGTTESITAIASWRQRKKSASRPQVDDDEIFPFAMETSHFHQRSENTGNTPREGVSER